MAGFARILLCGEGPQDMGRDPFPSARTGGYVDQEGWMQPLIRKFADNDAYLQFIRFPRSKAAAGTGGNSPRPPLEGHGVAAYNAMRQAVFEECDIVVFMVDNDGRRDRNRARWREICEEIWAGFDAAGEAACGVACIPISASEAWLLASESAWRACGLGVCTDLPGADAEIIWGARNDPNGGHPHRYFARICVQAGLSDSVPTRNMLGEHLSPHDLMANCPTSFIPFARSMEMCLARKGCVSNYDFNAIPARPIWCHA